MKNIGYIDYNHVPEEQQSIHELLVNWARWIKSGSGGWACHPMWKPCVAKEQEALRHKRGEEPKEPIHVDDAIRIERAVAALPDKHRKSVRWCYVFQRNPLAACKAIAVSKDELARLVKDGRQMLINRERLLAKPKNV